MGASEGVSADIHITALAQDIAELLAHLRLREVDILGFSYGMFCAMTRLS
jgi:pimeloyl-ACP methyl ester carboxylesterase